MTLGQRIYQYRRAKSLSQEDLAESLNVSRQSVSKWETDGSIPDLDKMVALSELFGITLDQLVKGESAAEASAPAPRTGAVPTDCDWEGSPYYVPTTAPEESGNPPPMEPLWSPRRVVGVILLGLALGLSLLIFLLTWDIIGTRTFTSALWFCGVICLTIRHNTAVYCGWGAVIGLSSFLTLQTRFSFYNFDLVTTLYSFFRFKQGPFVSGVSSNPVGVALHMIGALMVIALMITTVVFVSRRPIALTRRTVKGFCIAAGVYLLLDAGIRILNMEFYMSLQGLDTWVDGRLYVLLSELQGCVVNLRNAMRPMAVTAVATVIAALYREKAGKLRKS